MAGSAILGSNLVDELIPDVVDGLRDVLHPEFGVRQFRVWTVLREWTTGEVGEGEYIDTETEIEPQPLVESWLERVSGLNYSLEPCGLDEAGLVRLREVSLTYTHAELVGDDIGPHNGTEWFIKITDAHGQAIPDAYFTIKRPPFPDREKDIGWVVELERLGVS